jgi:hypothetical protein
MRKQTTTLNHNPKWTLLPLALLSVAALSPVLAADDKSAESAHVHPAAEAPAKLVQMVRDATRQYADVNAAVAAGYGAFLGCVSGPDHGAMGVHYVNGNLVDDGEIDATRPEALIYEPYEGGMRLVGVEFIVDAAAWMATHSAPPVLEGQTFQLVNSPNRYGLPAFFELHVWAGRKNPNGAFVDWNTRVSFEGK